MLHIYVYYPHIFWLLPNVRAVVYLCYVTFIDFYSTFSTAAYIYLYFCRCVLSFCSINEYDDNDAATGVQGVTMGSGGSVPISNSKCSLVNFSCKNASGRSNPQCFSVWKKCENCREYFAKSFSSQSWALLCEQWTVSMPHTVDHATHDNDSK